MGGGEEISLLHGGHWDGRLRGVEGWCLEKGGRGKEKKGRKKNRSHRATVQAPAKTARVRGGLEWGRGGRERDPR